MQTIDENGQYHGAVATPIFQTSLFAQPDFETFTKVHQKERENFVYSRGVNPTVRALEIKLATLERAEECKCFASGMGAISATMLTLLQQGDHVLFLNTIYGPTRQLLDFLHRYGVSYDHSNPVKSDIERDIKPNTKVIYLESPSTNLMDVADLKAISTLAKQHNIVTVIDNTWSTPLFQKPLEFGIDLVLHSLTKYIGGHSDLIGGAVAGNRKTIDRIFEEGFLLTGSVLSPNDAFLVLRGLSTLPVRMKQHWENAKDVIAYLLHQPEVEHIFHPSQATGETKKIVQNQMKGFSGLLSFSIRDASFEDVRTFINAFTLFKIGVSWGGYESLVIAPIRENNAEKLRSENIPPGLIRLSIGLEGSALQINDLNKGFNALRNR
ncbi:trans-sulfuration enzyme family protein [Aureibacillus halotolerans]|nr:PLP-dependent aspartate aminotransferase family protein [Aureibacillus halotolerans]